MDPKLAQVVSQTLEAAAEQAANELTFTVVARASVPLETMSEADRKNVGSHEIRLPGAWAQMPGHELASAVLDAFHNTVTIGELEQFEVEVFDAQGVELIEE